MSRLPSTKQARDGSLLHLVHRRDGSPVYVAIPAREDRSCVSGLFADLYKLTGEAAWTEFNEDVGQFGVWVGDADESDLVGAGDSESEAIEDAIRTARGWQRSAS